MCIAKRELINRIPRPGVVGVTERKDLPRVCIVVEHKIIAEQSHEGEAAEVDDTTK